MAPCRCLHCRPPPVHPPSRSHSPALWAALTYKETLLYYTAPVFTILVFQIYPPILAFDLADANVKISSSLNINVNESVKHTKLRGIIYYGHNHFISRIITGTNQIRFHDGITTGSQTIYEGLLNQNFDLSVCKEKLPSMAIYAADYIQNNLHLLILRTRLCHALQLGPHPQVVQGLASATLYFTSILGRCHRDT